ncbi:MAG TPA: hypothetical protein VK125_06670 [Bacillota bacterium]|nr:hypothetical protein [Bacillota bacterium]
MSVQQVSQSFMTKTSQKQPIRQGQILYGKIIKIHPNNQAQLQLGSQVINAQLEAPLSVGNHYYLQVESVEDAIHLKVVSGHLSANQSVSERVEALLQQLNLQAKKHHVSLVTSLMKDNIPFTKADLRQAFQWLSQSNNKQAAEEILKQMFIRHLPMTESVFSAMQTVQSNSLTQMFSQLYEQLMHLPHLSTVEQSLMDRLHVMFHSTMNNEALQMDFGRQLLQNDWHKSQELFHFLRLSGAVHESVSFTQWKESWQQQGETNANQFRMPFNISLKQLQTNINHLQNNRMIETVSTNITREWVTTVNLAFMNGQSLSDEDFQSLNRQVREQLLPLLTNEQQDTLTTLLQNKADVLIRLLAHIRSLSSPMISEVATKADHIFQQYNQLEGSPSSTQHQFLDMAKNYLRSIGLSYEAVLSNDLSKANMNDIKPLLINLSQSDSIVQARAQQALHFINGMQIQSLNDSTNLLQASLQIPGEPFALNKDMLMNFESKQTEDGKINSDYCRILFYLDLKRLKEVVIDLQIQKRVISISVFNDHPEIKGKSTLFEPLLQKQLDEAGYTLSNVSFHPLQAQEEEQDSKQKQTTHSFNHYEGYDFRV